MTVDGGEGAGSTNLSATQGLHYAFGTFTPSPPTNVASATYSLLGATKATSDSGNLGLGNFTGGLAVDFNSQKVGTDFSVAFPSVTYRVMTTGGVSNVLASEMTYAAFTAGLTFGQFLGSQNTLRDGAPCTSGCSSRLMGFFAGTNAERAGLAYRIYDYDSTEMVSGAATLTQASTTAPLGGTNIALNFAGSHDTIPPGNLSDSFQHPNTTGTVDVTTGALTAINEGGNTTIGTATAVESGRDGIIGWSRWTNGTLGGTGNHAGATLSGNLSFHSVYGVPTSNTDMAALASANQTATYALIGMTSPTDATGAVSPGVVTSGSMTARFGAGQVDVNLGVIAPILYTVSATNLPITGSGFGGTGNVTTASGCSGCSANLQGFFAGSMAARAGVAYTISDFSGPKVNGAAAFAKTGVGPPP